MDKNLVKFRYNLRESFIEFKKPVSDLAHSLKAFKGKTAAASSNTVSETEDYMKAMIGLGMIDSGQLEIMLNRDELADAKMASRIHSFICKENKLAPESVIVKSGKRFQPMAGKTPSKGEKIGHKLLLDAGSYGTLGGYFRKKNKNYIISNNHVLANENAAKTGDKIYHVNAGGNEHIANLEQFVPLDSVKDNKLDLAIAEVANEINPAFYSLKYRRAAVIGERVVKLGATTGITYGWVRSNDYDLLVEYDNFVANFTNQMQIADFKGAFCDGGDSGSLIFSLEDGAYLGLLFAGTDKLTAANHQKSLIETINQWLP